MIVKDPTEEINPSTKKTLICTNFVLSAKPKGGGGGAEDMLKSGHLRQWRSELQLPIVDQYF